MVNSQTPNILQPGVDSASHIQPTYQNVANQVTQATGIPTDSSQVTPVSAQVPQVSEVQKPFIDLDFEDIKNREFGKKWGNEKAKSFLDKVKERLTKKYPNKEVKQ